MYTIIHVEKGWIVCDGQTKLIRFKWKSVAVRTAHDAAKLLRANEAAQDSETCSGGEVTDPNR